MNSPTLQTRNLLFLLCLVVPAANAPAQPRHTPSRTDEPSAMATRIPTETSSATPIPNAIPKTSKEAHGDVLVFWATIALVVVTLLLVLTTYLHVRHSRELVETVRKILAIDRMARLAASINCENSQEPRICLQNIGRVPVRVLSLSISFDSQPPESIVSAQSVWILPLQAALILHRELANLWSEQTYTKIAIACTFQDVYSETDSQRSFSTIGQWTIDYKRRVMVSGG